VRAVEALHDRTTNPERLAHATARTLRLFLGHPALLTPAQRQSEAERYRQHILHAAADGSFSIVALVWRVGHETAVHDHVSWCAVGVHQGCEEEISYRHVEVDGQPCLVRGERQLFNAGATSALVPPGDIHVVRNPGPGEAISIHIYGADVRRLGSSIRQRYDLPILEPATLEPAAAAERRDRRAPRRIAAAAAL
jgi:predicted metal-dependent enzyme (double-stranded beta helix superfamily)